MLSFSARPPTPNPLDGCVYLYLDMGTNIGVQIRCPPLPSDQPVQESGGDNR